MRAEDIPLGLHLCRQAGWNQLEPDWRRFLAMQPEGCFVAELDGRPIATTVTCTLGPVAWIAMVLVEMSARRKGIATALLKHALDSLDEQGVGTIRLDATAAGRPVYERLGFLPEYQLMRYQGVAPRLSPRPDVTQAPATRWTEIAAFDQGITGTPREKMLTPLFADSPHGVRVVRRDEQLEGYVSFRSGANATQIGPCLATARAGEALLADALRCCADRLIFIDIPSDNAPAVALAEANGLQPQRHFTRMYRGRPVHDRPDAIWAGSGPEKG